MSATRGRVRRRLVACARCRVRKIVCDAASPSCTKCSNAGVPCVALSASKQGTAPRSIVQFLENELAAIRRTQNRPLQASTASTRNSIIDDVIKDFTPSFMGLTASIPLLQCTVAGTRLPSASSPGTFDLSGQEKGLSVESQAGATRLADIPTSVADFLFENYVKRVAILYPIYHLQDIVGFFNSVYHHPIHSLEPGSLATPYEIYTVSLIMAISLTTSARTQQLRANSIAMGLFRNAMQHIQNVCTNDLQGLQAVLLLGEYAFLNPGVANVWLLSGFTTQMCIDLGLHQETPDRVQNDPAEFDLRRCVFWCAYEMEIATSSALLRPTVFQRSHINVAFPSELEDCSTATAEIDPNAQWTKSFALWVWKYRQIEAEIVSVLFYNGEITARGLESSLDSWMQRMELAINTWKVEFQWFSAMRDGDPVAQEMHLYADIAHAYIIVTLFRPAPRVKEPSCENLMKAFIAGVNVAKGYLSQSNLAFGNSKFVFHTCYHTFSAAVVFLQALDRCKHLICLRYTVDQVDDFISVFSKEFTATAERWPAASRCLEEFEKLMVPVKRKFIDFALNEARMISNEMAANPSLTVDEEALQPALYSDELMDFQSLFPHDVFNTQDPLGIPFTIPSDWGIEFDFGMI